MKKLIKNSFLRIQEFIFYLKNKYIEKIHSKLYSSYLYAFLIIFFLLLMVFLNILFMANHRYNINQIFGVLFNWNDDKDGIIISVNFKGLDRSSITNFQIIQTNWYNVAATILAGVGMTLAAVATQSLTRNPIAEGSTLGLVQSGIFGIIFGLSFGMSELWMRYLWIILFSSVGSLLILSFVLFNKNKNSGIQRIILAGLALGIIFKTITFIFKSGSQNQNIVSFAYVLGGAESISGEPLALGHDLIPIFLLTSLILIFVATTLAFINIKGMNLLEIGDERAKNLGSPIIATRIIDILIVLISLPAAVILVGNMAFLGLFSVHLAKWICKSRNYKKVLPLSLVIGMLIASFGFQLTEHIPKINSGIWMTFIGAPYLIYVGIKGLK